MQMRLRLLDREDCFSPRTVSFIQLLEGRGLKQKHYRKALKSLTVLAQRQPRPQRLMAQDNARPLEHLFDR